MNWLNEFLNKQPKNTNEYSYLDKIRQDFEKTYNSTENNNFSEVVKNSKKLYNKNNPYGHTEKFVELDEKTKEEAHRVISHVAVEMGRKGKLYGSASDINGNTYDFEIFSDTTYRVTEVEFSDNFKEEINEKYNNSDNRYSVRGSIDEQSDYDFNISTDRNGRRSNENVEVSSREQGQQGDNGYRLFDTQQEENNTIKNSKELDNSSFSLDENAKRYDDLLKTNKIEYFTKGNGDIRVYMIDSNNNLVNEIDLISESFAKKQLGEELGSKIFNNSNEDTQTLNIGNDINNTQNETDYFMNHRPTETKGYGTQEQKDVLESNIKRDGITSPIELIYNKNGDTEIYNGNHRLEIAKKLGLREVPFIYKNKATNNNEIIYNSETNEDLNYIKGDENGSFRNNENIEEKNDRSRTGLENSNGNSISFENEGTTGRNDTVLRKTKGYNNESSSDSTYRENTIKNSKELEDSSFSLDKLPKVKNGYTRLYRGLNEEYNPNYDRSILDSPNGYDTLTDNYELAKQYGKNVYYIDIPTNQLANSVKIGKENYKNNLGELISNTTKIYSDFTQKELNDIILPEIAKENPRYENIKNELNNINSRDFLNKLDKGIYDYEINDYTKKYENKTSYYEDTMDYEQEKHKGRLSKELDNSSFSLEEKQNEIIQKTNPMLDDYHTGIRSAEDIKTFDEAFFEDFDGKYYKIVMSVGKNGDINTIYNVGKLAQRKRPVFSGSSVKNGANGSLTITNNTTKQTKSQKGTTLNEES